MQNAVFEILKWQAKDSCDDKVMLESMGQFSIFVKNLPGFLHQSLYKNSANEWVCIYFWATEKDAHDSNQAVADQAVFHKLMSLIDEKTLSMEVMPALQYEGSLQFST